MFIRFLNCLIIILFACNTFTLAYAEPKVTSGSAGNYLGLQVGESIVHSSNKTLKNNLGIPVLTHPSNNGFGLRLLTGYQFNDYVALEGGYGYYSPSDYNIQNGHSPEFRIQALDFVGKGIFPFGKSGFDVYAKGGLAIIYFKEGGLLAPSSKGGADGSSGIKARPIIGGGFSYTFTPNWAVDLSGSRILKGGGVPNSDLFTIGISYHAVDLYCGQFLC